MGYIMSSAKDLANAKIGDITTTPVGETKDGKKVFFKKTGKNKKEYVDINDDKVDGRKVKLYNTPKRTEEKIKHNGIWLTKRKFIKTIEKETKDKEDKIYEDQEAFEKRRFNGEIDAFGNVLKPVIKKNVIIETPKPEPKKTQGKQTADQLEKRRLKYQENREKELARKRAYREANKEKINAKQDETRKTEKSKEYQKAYREKNAKIPEPRRTKLEVRAGVKAGGLGKGVLRYMDDTNKLIKKYGTQTPRKVRTDVGKKRGDYKKKEKKNMFLMILANQYRKAERVVMFLRRDKVYGI